MGNDKKDSFLIFLLKVIAIVFVFAAIVLILLASWGIYKKFSTNEVPVKVVKEEVAPAPASVAKQPKAVLTLYAPHAQKKQACVKVATKQQKHVATVAPAPTNAFSKSIPVAVVVDNSIPTAVVTPLPVVGVIEVNCVPTAKVTIKSDKPKPGLLDDVDTEKKAVITPQEQEVRYLPMRRSYLAGSY